MGTAGVTSYCAGVFADPSRQSERTRTSYDTPLSVTVSVVLSSTTTGSSPITSSEEYVIVAFGAH